MGEMDEEVGHAACLSPLGELAPVHGVADRRVQSKALGFIDREREGSDWGRTQPTIPQAPRQPTEVALPTTSWGLHAQAWSPLRDGATWAARRPPWAQSPTEGPGTQFIKYRARVPAFSEVRAQNWGSYASDDLGGHGRANLLKACPCNRGRALRFLQEDYFFPTPKPTLQKP